MKNLDRPACVDEERLLREVRDPRTSASFSFLQFAVLNRGVPVVVGAFLGIYALGSFAADGASSAQNTLVTSSAQIATTSLPSEMDKFNQFDALGEPGTTTYQYFPSFDTLGHDKGGWRSDLAKHDISVQDTFFISMATPLRSTGQPRDPQLYNGQRFTVMEAAFQITPTFGLASWGLPNSKIVTSVMGLTSSFERGNSPNTVAFQSLYYYQSFADKAVELKVGWNTNYYDYVGMFLGGSPFLSGGVSGLVPLQVGMSASPTPAPMVNLTFNAKNDTYLKLGVQRSSSPHGQHYEQERDGFHGLNWKQDDAGPLYLAEAGINRPAAPGEHRQWLRAGYMYNNSDYTKFSGDGTSANRGVYAAGDYQLTQPSQDMSFRGVYVGATAYKAPEDVNAYTNSYEARLYWIGPVESRPTDTVSFKYNYNKFSSDLGRASEAQGAFFNSDQTQYALSYSAHAFRGVYMIPSVIYTKHPSIIGDFNNSVVAALTIAVGF
ncbi:hypothetical protein PS900_00677 [Pseudomonas fluorescens]|uniref:Porin n=1 Tax=Pseudomonas fluorescens TaxID=294 RepID=A0A8H2RPJ0_PSEFL|nr:carbohydrate porin [Pseudomonas fluorescens]VVO58583.1 hypothetical protein PS900_00677 [Pseudomonas fluorescens]